MKKETKEQRSKRILNQLRTKYPGKKAFDLDGRGKHFACEIEPTEKHPEYDRAIEVIISSKPHKHLKTTNYYTVISGTLELYVEDETIILEPGDKYMVEPGKVHWAKSRDGEECWAEIYSEPGWTKEDHIPVEISN
ncbi:MAG: cupin domain-containing protein [Patescibacteria group bacterium]|nr:cupin domain-containing protein [Patescibacteria group bacterium]